MRTLVDSAIDGVRRAASRLRPPLLDTMGLKAALEWQADEFAKDTEIECVKDIDDIDVPPEAAIAMFRVVQEGLTNVARHAGATRVVVRLFRDDERVVVEVEDNGCGLDSSKPPGPRSAGLVGMQERAEALGGEFRIHGTDGEGTRIVFAVPIKTQGEAA
jgi:signal transduction histidine kinase